VTSDFHEKEPSKYCFKMAQNTFTSGEMSFVLEGEKIFCSPHTDIMTVRFTVGVERRRVTKKYTLRTSRLFNPG
jgi:hypothetical protein